MTESPYESYTVDFWRQVGEKYQNCNAASKVLGIDHKTIKKYMEKHNVSFPADKLSMDNIKSNIIACGGVSLAAKALGVNASVIQDRLYREGTSLKEIMSDFQYKIAPEQRLQETIQGDCVITADYHCPFVSLKWIDRVVNVGKEENVKQLLIAGDFFDFDRLSWWLKVSNAEDMAVTLDDELSLASMVLERLEEQYTTIYFIGGNHWLRLLKNITFSISSKRLLGLVGRAADNRYKINEHFDWIMVDDKVRVTHPGKARKSDYTLSRDLSYLHPNQWLVVAHRHRVNEGFSPSGIPMLEIGWLGDNERMRYIQHTDSTYYEWIQGFALYKNSKLHNLTEYNYDWSKIDK